LKESSQCKFDTRGNEPGDFDKEGIKLVPLEKNPSPSTTRRRQITGAALKTFATLLPMLNQ